MAGPELRIESRGDGRPKTKTRLRGVGPSDVKRPDGLPRKIGRYEVLKVLGKGAMGVVYKARDPLLDRIVAIKTIFAPRSLAENVRKAYFERFDREAKSAARIAHPACVTIFDVGSGDEAPFLVMEYLPGETLADRLDRGRMPLGPAVQAARDLASGLASAHVERIVHRDVKPANVLFAGANRWKLADFGIARLPDSDLTQIGIFMGTPGYAPPEAIREGNYTEQADVFAWGAVFYELLCGRIPYEGPDTKTTNKFVLASEPKSPRDYDRSIPEPLAQVCLTAMSHDAKKRYKNCTDVEAALVTAWDQSLKEGLVRLEALSFVGQLPMPGDVVPIPQQGSEPVGVIASPATREPPAAAARPAPPPPPARSVKTPTPAVRDDDNTIIDPRAAERAARRPVDTSAPTRIGPPPEGFGVEAPTGRGQVPATVPGHVAADKRSPAGLAMAILAILAIIGVAVFLALR